MRLVTTGVAGNFSHSIVGRVTTHDLPTNLRSEYIRFVTEGYEGDTLGYRAVLSDSAFEGDTPSVSMLRETSHIHDGDVVVLEGGAGFVRSLYRPREQHHHIFVTERCSSNCLMCSQPPKDRDDVDVLTRRNIELVRLIEPAPDYITITGGEPTLLGDSLHHLIAELRDRLPSTELHMLTNGRTFGFPGYASRFAETCHPNISIGVPLYSDYAPEHDHVVQAKHAFDQTVRGLHEAARHGIRCEIRIVLHKLTVPRLTRLAEYIFRNLPFVEHVALMGLEHTGYTPRNISSLWIDPFDYQPELESAVEYLAMRGMTVSIYNHQLCVLPQSIWSYSKRSISDWKNSYPPECDRCTQRNDCGGFFQWKTTVKSQHIQPFL